MSADPAQFEGLLTAAAEAARHSYSPFSHFRVGAAVLAGGVVHSGSNIENASYGLSMCAERVAIFGAVASGHRSIDAMALACIDAGAGTDPGQLVPCGACRQVLAEFARPSTPVIVAGAGVLTLADLLPVAFRLNPRRP